MDLSQWYDAQWGLAVDFKEEFITLLENSKFGGREYTPYEIYMKALYEYFKDDLNSDLSLPSTRSAVELAEFQEDGVEKERGAFSPAMMASSWRLGRFGQNVDRQEAAGRLRLSPATEGAGHLPGIAQTAVGRGTALCVDFSVCGHAGAAGAG